MVEDQDEGLVLPAGSKKISPKKTRFANAIIEGKSVKEAAEVCGFSERTGRRYLNDPAVIGMIQAVYRAVLVDMSVRLSEVMGDAVRVLHEIVVNAPAVGPDGKEVPQEFKPSDRVKAAAALLGAAVRICGSFTRTPDDQAAVAAGLSDVAPVLRGSYDALGVWAVQMGAVRVVKREGRRVPQRAGLTEGDCPGSNGTP